MNWSFWREALLGRRPTRTFVRLAVLVIVSVFIFGWVLLPVRTYGDSMLPTYSSGSFHLVNRAAYSWRAPARGDVIAVRLAGWRVVYVKRIVALPGERIAIRSGVVLVNHRPLDEPYVSRRQPWNMSEVLLGGDEYFVIGDNRGMRMTDHEFGTVRRERIAGPLLF
ncbi:MAG TPA: signal peptidase I [Vicinamibacterales bacterium]|nr:signal peptidase I [Vicinamibacterales bacterium]